MFQCVLINVYTCVTTTTVKIENILSLSDFPLVNPLLAPLQETSDLLSMTIDKTFFLKFMNMESFVFGFLLRVVVLRCLLAFACIGSSVPV